MKTIEPVSIWDNGVVQQATVLNAYAASVILNSSAAFSYALFKQNEDGSIATQLIQGGLTMTGESYEQWTVDSYAWDWVAEQLNLTITGDYVPPVPPAPEPPAPEPTPEPEVVEPEVGAE